MAQLKRRYAVLAFFGTLILALIVAEVAARLLGHEPYARPDYKILIEPGQKYQAAHPVLGYRHLPGLYRVTFPNGDSWMLTHRPDTLRITRPPSTYKQDRAVLWLFGCSFVHGWGLDDNQTLGWMLQTAIPDLDVVNFGVGGYGTWQSLLQYRMALEEGPAPRIAVLAYAGFHDERNTRTRRWRRATFAYDSFGTTAQPYVRMGKNGELVEHFDDGEYREFFLLRHFALANLLDDLYSKAQHKALRSHEVSRRIIETFAEEARAQGTFFVLAGIHRGPGTASMLEWAESEGIPVVDITVDLTDPQNRIAFDRHPNAAANYHEARKLAEFLYGAKRRP